MLVFHRDKEKDEDCLISIQMLISHSCASSIHRLIFNHAERSVFGSIYTTVQDCSSLEHNEKTWSIRHVPVKLTCFIIPDNVLLLTMRNMLSIAYIMPRIITLILSISGKQMSQLAVLVACRTL